MMQFSDLPMDFETFGVPPGSHVPGPVLHRYLMTYAEYFGVFQRIKFGATVKTAELQDNSNWLIRYELEHGEQMTLLTSKMVMATGTTSEPNMPSIKGSGIFRGQMFHSKELPIRSEEMNATKNVVIYGGSKSASDAVYMNASKGRHVDWVIRGKITYL